MAAVALLDGFAALQAGQLQDFGHQSFAVYRPHAQRVARLVTDTGAGQIDFDVLHVFLGMACSDFLAHR